MKCDAEAGLVWIQQNHPGWLSEWLSVFDQEGSRANRVRTVEKAFCLAVKLGMMATTSNVAMECNGGN